MKKKIGRTHKITPAMRKKLVEFILTDCSTCFILLLEVPFALGWDVSEGCICDFLRHQSFNLCHLRIKPFKNNKYHHDCLQWAWERLDSDIPKWHTILWTEEMSMQCLGQSCSYLTCLKVEEHNLNCIEPKIKKFSQCMLLASISGLIGKGLKKFLI
jgi:hypothetical protein